jgi:hypothetical protein
MTTGDAPYEAGDVNLVDDSQEAADDELGYEEGDVNTVGAGPASRDRADLESDDEQANQAAGDMSTKVLDYIARSLADDPDSVVIETEERRGAVVLRLHVAPGDMGRVIGRRGRTAQAIRTLVGVAGAIDGIRTSVDIVDE